MKNDELSEIQEENWKRINSLMEVRQKQFEDIYKENWWNYLIEDDLYKHLCQKLVEIKLMGKPTFLIKRDLNKEDVNNVAIGFITAEDYIKKITKE
jgi:hypothetical protein